MTVRGNGAITRVRDSGDSAEIDATGFDSVAVVGGGAWGTALALTAHRANRKTSLWIKEREIATATAARRINPFLADVVLPQSLHVTCDLGDAIRDAELVILAVPSQFLRGVCRNLESALPPGIPVVICSKGIETDTGALMSTVVAEEMPDRPLSVLSGPTFAAEVALGEPTAVTIASADAAEEGELHRSLAARVAATLATPSFRPYLSDDVVGVEVGGAVKNVIAIACGMATGLGLGSNPRAALITRGLAELKRLAETLGGRRETVTGLAGLGDLTLTCSSEQSRNFTLGKALAGGATADGAMQGKSVVVEGVANAQSVAALARRLGVDMPICQAVNAIIHHGMAIESVARELLGRPLRAESRDLEHGAKLAHPAPGIPFGTHASA